MEGWKENIISDFGEVVTGSTPSTKNNQFWENGDYPFYSPADFSDKMFCDVTEKHITKAGLLTGRVIYPNSVMVTCIASIGKMAVNTSLGITNQQINTIVINSDFDFRFVYYLLLKTYYLNLYSSDLPPLLLFSINSFILSKENLD